MFKQNMYLKNLKNDGYCVLPKIIGDKECNKIKQDLESIYKKYKIKYAKNVKSKHRLNHQEDEKIVYNLQNKHPVFINLASNKKIIEIVKPYLQLGSYNNSDEIILRQLTARNPKKKKGFQQLHIDSRIPGLKYSIMVVVTIMLDDFTKLNGATRLIPKSHQKNTFPRNNKIYKQEKQILAPKGSVLIMDGGLWHGGGENVDGSSRWCLLFTYVRWFIKQAFNFSENIPIDIYKNLTEEQKALLGLNSNPPVDEFQRISAKSILPEHNENYKLPIK